MKIRIIYQIVFALLFIAGCSDTVTNHYTTRSKAEADRLFERGWLPDLIPMSVSEITTSNNLDTNTSEGKFQYNPNETKEFLRHLRPYSGQKLPLSRWQTDITEQKKKGYDALEYVANKSIWIFLVNAQTGHVRYMMWLS